jgi:diguanylate cyclase (GGDEF)-like protein
MNRFTGLRHHFFPLALVILTFALYVWGFAEYYAKLGIGVASLAIFPVIVAGLLFGMGGALLLAILCVVAHVFLHAIAGDSLLVLFTDLSTYLSMLSLFVVAMSTGMLSARSQQRKDAIHKLEQYEKERQVHTRFLELVNEITARALEADSLEDTLGILIEKLAHLFQADDAFFAFWDAANEIPVPTVAYGSLTDVYPYMQFEPNEAMLSSFVMRSKQPIFVPDIENTAYISPRIAALFPSRSMLGVPLIAQDHKLGVIILGFNKAVLLDQEDIVRAEIVAEQLALVLSKSQVLEDERRQVRQLSTLHAVALVAAEAENEDQLIERVSHIIGQNLYPDNFGMMLLDERSGYLRAHPSYRFYMAEDLKMRDLRLGQGITGSVAKSGQPQRFGNVRRVSEYIDVDDRTVSELCVPIKFRERVLGVINAESTKRDAFSDDDERLLVILAGQLAPAIEQFRKAKTERYILDQLAHDKDLIYSIAQITAQIERSLKADQIIRTMGQELEKIGLTCIMAVYDVNLKTFTINYTSMSQRLVSIVERLQGYALVQHTFPRQRLETMLKKDEMFRPSVISNISEELKTIFTHINGEHIPLVLKRVGVVDGVQPLRLPLVFEENLLGMLWIWGEGVTRSDLPILSIFAKQIGMTLERARLFEEVQSLAFTDPLTGLQNRRSLFELGKIEFSRATRLNRPFSCMMLDLDHFKRINDQYGHQTGDHVLQDFALRCKRSIRDIDLVGRYGGEEVIVLLPETNRELAVQVAERLRASVAKNPVRLGDAEIPLTVSIGVATKDENTTDLEALIARADQAMYIAKHKGRNQVAISI